MLSKVCLLAFGTFLLFCASVLFHVWGRNLATELFLCGQASQVEQFTSSSSFLDVQTQITFIRLSFSDWQCNAFQVQFHAWMALNCSLLLLLILLLLVHAFVSSRVDYCNAVFTGALKIITDRLQWVLNADARVVSDTQKFDHSLSHLMHTELHWLDVPERVQYKLGVLMYRCQHNQAPRYLTDHCTPVSDTVFRQHLRSASSHQVSVPHYRLSTYGRRAFSVAGSTVWNSLLKTCEIQSALWTVTDSHWRHFYFRSTSVFSALEVCYENVLYKFIFDIWHWHTTTTSFILCLCVFCCFMRNKMDDDDNLEPTNAGGVNMIKHNGLVCGV